MYIIKDVGNHTKTYKTYEEALEQAKKDVLEDAYDQYIKGAIVAKVETFVKADLPTVPVVEVSTKELEDLTKVKELN